MPSPHSTANVAAVLGWLINVGVNFAHVSPTFQYTTVMATDKYCDIIELARDIMISYSFQTIRQMYKVVFSLNLLGDPNLLAHQWKTGFSDLVHRTRKLYRAFESMVPHGKLENKIYLFLFLCPTFLGDELAAGGKDGFGKGIASFAEHVFGKSQTTLLRVSNYSPIPSQTPVLS